MGGSRLTYKVTDAYGNDPTFGPDLTIIAYGVDDSGAQIAAGDIGGGAETPEPSAVYMSGLGALVLGAEGLRRWRAAKRQVAPASQPRFRLLSDKMKPNPEPSAIYPIRRRIVSAPDA